MSASTRKAPAALLAALMFLLLVLIGCAAINAFIFTPKKGILATPASGGIPYREVWFQSPDGPNLNGWLIAGAPDTPLILFFHGNAGNLSDNLDYIKLLHGHGYPIFIFDYRGYGKSGGQPFWEKDLYQDARGAIRHLEATGWRREGMIFFGQSLGAAVALQMALESPPKGLVMESSFTCLKDIARHLSPFGYYTVGWWGIDLPFDNLSKIASVNVPLLMIHGEEDEVAPVEMTMRLFARAPQPKTLHIVAGGGHCDVNRLDRSAYLAVWSSYLQAMPVRSALGEGVRP